jgi:hypothetical protein
MAQFVEGQTSLGEGTKPQAGRLTLSRVRLADDAAGYRHAAQVYAELANNARCLAESTPSLAEHYGRTQRHWLHWQARCLRAADLHDQLWEQI